MPLKSCCGCDRSDEMVIVNNSGPDGPMSLCSACSKLYRNLRLPLFKLGSGPISACPSEGAVRLIATGFETVSKYSDKVKITSPQVRSATAEEHYNLRRMRRIFRPISSKSTPLQPQQPKCFACSTHSVARKLRHGGPDGPGTLCSNCNHKYVAHNLPLFQNSSGKVSARPFRGAARVVVVGFERNKKKGIHKRDHCKPVVRPSSKREHSFLMRQRSLDHANEGESEAGGADDDGENLEERHQKIVFNPADQSGEELQRASKGAALPRTRSRSLIEEDDIGFEPTSKRTRAQRQKVPPQPTPSLLANIPQVTAITLPAPSQAASVPTSVAAAKGGSSSPGSGAQAISLRGFCVKASCQFGWRSEKRMVFVAYGARFSALERALRRLFRMQLQFEVSYTDHEGDEIKVSSDVEMHPMFMQAKMMKNSLSVQVSPTAVAFSGLREKK